MDVKLNWPTTAGKKNPGQGGYQEPKCHSDRFTLFLGCNGDLASGTRVSAALCKLRLYGRVATRKLLLNMTQDVNPGSCLHEIFICMKLTTCNHSHFFFSRVWNISPVSRGAAHHILFDNCATHEPSLMPTPVQEGMNLPRFKRYLP